MGNKIAESSTSKFIDSITPQEPRFIDFTSRTASGIFAMAWKMAMYICNFILPTLLTKKANIDVQLIRTVKINIWSDKLLSI